ncbi:D-lactate dehydrogenase [Alteromonas sediminis]|uniref:Quinone-dependent D-lactate dehydrogenase n=1 Tax=Alteromonas sediminis TaxID=2259342 RepID=A0A3N5ZB11_9ALTE|nr:D-lactate dehydrogenase [Alteromonas sediminis]RPJ68404.1 D-lactate dehydrogenase [Alteromonas sediminis]
MSRNSLIDALISLLGEQNVAVHAQDKSHYVKGWRSGQGDALAVVFPQSLLQYWRVLQACVEADCIIIMQAANTGLTEGSTPASHGYDRDIVVINTLAMDGLHILGEGEQVVSLPGATLHKLEKTLAGYERAPHSVIGSSCLGASIVGGIANNSGGALVKRGPAYTELSLYAKVDENGELQLVNHLGIELGDSPEAILQNLEDGSFDKSITPHTEKASATDYVDIIRDIESPIPARFNADTSRLFEASGCAGKLAVFAVRLDTFEQPEKVKTYYIGTNKAGTLNTLRRHILSNFTHLPEVGEYMHRDIFNISHQYGKDTFLSVAKLGTDSLPKLFAAKGKIDAFCQRTPWLPNYLTDKVMQFGAKLFPEHLPERLREFERKYEHHLIVKMSDAGIEEADAFLPAFFADAEKGEYFECSEREASSAYLHRFAAAGAAMRYQIIHEQHVGDILALDIALPRNTQHWVETLPPELHEKIEKRLYYGHFFCHVFHQDYIIKKGVNPDHVKAEILALLDARGAKYPAEHNVGHLYDAEPQVKAFYRSLDPTNRFNPGVGKMDKHKRNCSCC